MSDLPALTGGCLCGRTRYEATPDHRDGYYCHCRMCQLAFGNTRAAYFNLRKSQVRWTGEPPRYYASSRIARRAFCGHCGTPLSFEFHDSENMDLSIGSLDEPSQMKPTEHWAVESRIAAWHVPDGLPEHRLDENERIMKRWKDAYGDDVQAGVDAGRGREP
jgi:hypothetical protein